MKFSMQQEMLKHPLTAEAAMRKDTLFNLLQKNSMPLRDDSSLAYKFITDGGDVQLTAHELLCTNFLFQNTRYNEHCQVQLRNMADSVHEMYGLPWKTTWSIVREYGVPAIKLYSLAESTRTMPDFDVSM